MRSWALELTSEPLDKLSTAILQDLVDANRYYFRLHMQDCRLTLRFDDRVTTEISLRVINNKWIHITRHVIRLVLHQLPVEVSWSFVMISITFTVRSSGVCIRIRRALNHCNILEM